MTVYLATVQSYDTSPPKYLRDHAPKGSQLTNPWVTNVTGSITFLTQGLPLLLYQDLLSMNVTFSYINIDIKGTEICTVSEQSVSPRREGRGGNVKSQK